jgi:hypothetical protein
LAFSAQEAGIYYLEIKLVSRPRDPVSYGLSLARGKPAAY